MAGFSDAEHKQKMIDTMADDTVAIFADVNGARIYAKLRGCTATEVGYMMGSIKASVNRQIEMAREQFLKVNGAEAHNAFIDGMKQGQKFTPAHEGIRIKQLGDQNG